MDWKRPQPGVGRQGRVRGSTLETGSKSRALPHGPIGKLASPHIMRGDHRRQLDPPMAKVVTSQVGTCMSGYRMTFSWAVGAAVAVLLALSGGALAQADHQDPPPQEEHAGDSADLAKKLSNPVASLISVPFQANYDCCFGNTNASRWVTNLQPVVPISISNDWNIILRTILPIINEQPSPIHPDSGFGIGDTCKASSFHPRSRPAAV